MARHELQTQRHLLRLAPTEGLCESVIWRGVVMYI